MFGWAECLPSHAIQMVRSQTVEQRRCLRVALGSQVYPYSKGAPSPHGDIQFFLTILRVLCFDL
jgi:hypothetical protein